MAVEQLELVLSGAAFMLCGFHHFFWVDRNLEHSLTGSQPSASPSV
jgi:hypothetical protein